MCHDPVAGGAFVVGAVDKRCRVLRQDGDDLVRAGVEGPLQNICFFDTRLVEPGECDRGPINRRLETRRTVRAPFVTGYPEANRLGLGIVVTTLRLDYKVVVPGGGAGAVHVDAVPVRRREFLGRAIVR